VDSGKCANWVNAAKCEWKCARLRRYGFRRRDAQDRTIVDVMPARPAGLVTEAAQPVRLVDVECRQLSLWLAYVPVPIPHLLR